MFELKKINFYYEKSKVILKNIDLKLDKGEMHVLIGENGSGKSTLLMLLKGINKHKSGEIYFKNKQLKLAKNEYITEVGYVFQNPDTQIIGVDVISDIELGPLNLGWNSEKINQSVKNALELCNITHLKEKSPNNLSYGEKKRVSIAAVLAMNPEVLILDEPTTWLDPYHKKELYKIIVKMKEEGKTVILSTHDIEFAKKLKCNYIFLKNGEIVAQGEEKLFNNVELMEKCNLLDE